MIVKFQGNFHVPGFDRKRFPKGVVKDVPENLREHLPKSAQILDETYIEEEAARREREEQIAKDLTRQGDQEVLIKAGLGGLQDAQDEAKVNAEESIKLALKLEEAEVREVEAAAAAAKAGEEAADKLKAAEDRAAEAEALLELVSDEDKPEDKPSDKVEAVTKGSRTKPAK